MEANCERDMRPKKISIVENFSPPFTSFLKGEGSKKNKRKVEKKKKYLTGWENSLFFF